MQPENTTGNESGTSIKVLIVDDHPVVRSGLRAALNNDPDLKYVGEAVDGLEAEDKAIHLKPDVIIMDILMPRRNGLEAMLCIKHKLPHIKFLFLTVSEQEEHLLQAIRLGADGYVLKKSDISDVMKAVKSIASGETYLSPLMLSRLIDEFKSVHDGSPLSSRENQVLELVTQGLTDSEIAEKLFISPRTVGTHMHRLLKKLHLKNRVEAATYCTRLNTPTR